ncbi:unnamed protein product [Brassicogethes aeneus]|uniref:Serpin domain-containing protein n=1 Tax=Brassicogethes aeneus TaxID=1431903 RepID=A0A9P0BHH8_BRAAE|nr:unnamed protein product [Brassicogethes aeneus]
MFNVELNAMILTVLFLVFTTAADAQLLNQYTPVHQFLQPQALDEIPQFSIQDQNQNENINLSDERHIFFDIALLKELAKTNENVLVSPLSIKTTLAMVLEGSKGICAEEIQKTLRIGSLAQARSYLKAILHVLKDTRYVESANAVFVSKKVQVYKDYQNKLQDYKGFIESLDFNNVPLAVQTINKWVNDLTKGAIPTIIGTDNIHKDFTVVLANALYFKGKWKTAFDEKSTRRDYFYLENGGRREVNMMQVSNNFNYQYNKNLHAEAVEIPYEDDFSMLIVMPAEGNNVENLATDMQKPSDIIADLKQTELNLAIPKFDMDYSKNLVDILKPLGVRTIFTHEANLTGIVPNDNIRVNNIVHKTKIQVDEQGTKAAAATGVIVIPLIGSTARKVVINRPFIYFIYHRETRAIIFEGIFRHPQMDFQRTLPPNLSSRGNFYTFQ